MSKKWMILGLVLAANAYGGIFDNEYAAKLNESVITTERYEETPVIETAKNVTVITGEDIEERGFKNVDEALNMIPSLNQIDGEISIRGQVPKMGARTVVVLVDGVPQNGMDNRVADLDFIPIEQVDKIEVLPSGGAVMYGGNASAGVINIVTKGTPDKKYWGRVGTEMGSYSYRKYNGNIGTKVTDRLSATVDYSTTDKKGYRHGEKKDLDFVQVGTNYKFDDGKIGFKYSHNKRVGRDVAGSLSEKQLKNGRRYNSYQGLDKERRDVQDKYIVNFDKRLSKDLELSGVFEYRHRDYKFYTDNHVINRDKDTDSYYTNLQMKYHYLDKNSVIIGGDYSKANVKEKSYGFNGDKKDKTLYNKENSKTDFYAIGGYVLNKVNYDKFIFTQGLRVEKNVFDKDTDSLDTYKKYKYDSTGKAILDKDGNHKYTTIFKKPLKYNSSNSKYKPTNTDIELTGNYMIDSEKSVYLSYNRVKRSPTLTEYTGWNKELSSNIKSQTLNTVELGTKSLFDNIYVSAATFYIHGDKEIMYDPGKKDNVTSKKSYYNLNGKTERYGLELATEEYFGDLTLRQNFTYMHNEIKSGRYKGSKIPGVPAITAGAGATYEIIPNLFVNADLRYVGRAYLANDFSNKYDKGSSHTLTDITLRYNMDNGLSVYGGIDNLFDKKYFDYSYVSDGTIKYSPAPERTYYIGLDYKF